MIALKGLLDARVELFLAIMKSKIRREECDPWPMAKITADDWEQYPDVVKSVSSGGEVYIGIEELQSKGILMPYIVTVWQDSVRVPDWSAGYGIGERTLLFEQLFKHTKDLLEEFHQPNE